MTIRCALLTLCAALTACAATIDPPSASAEVRADEVEAVLGVPDHGRDPAVVALEVAGVSLCTGALIAPDVVLTARHCVSETVDTVPCPPVAPQVLSDREPASVRVLAGDDVTGAREVARGAVVLVPAGDALCDADLAVVVLDRVVDGVAPLSVSKGGIAMGGHVVTVGYGKRGDGGTPGEKLLREHVRVASTSEREFVVGEATCQGDSGGPALDEPTGAVVGVVSRGGASCTGPGAHNVFTRVDAFLPLVDLALARSKAKPPKKGPAAPSDLGAACALGSDCATGVCVTAGGARYCSRPCDAADRCPTHFRCTAASDGSPVCVEH